jgi:hypothetical protein
VNPDDLAAFSSACGKVKQGVRGSQQDRRNAGEPHVIEGQNGAENAFYGEKAERISELPK